MGSFPRRMDEAGWLVLVDEDGNRQLAIQQELGARLLYDRTSDAGEPLFVLADPAGHPFCLLVGEP